MMSRRVARAWFTVLLLVLLGVNLYLSRRTTILPTDCELSFSRARDSDQHGLDPLLVTTDTPVRHQRPQLSDDQTLNRNASAFSWSSVAYMQYATDVAHLCPALLVFESLHRLGSKPDRILLFPADLLVDGPTVAGSLLRKARDKYGVKLVPVELQAKAGADPTWRSSFTKLLAFNQTQYRRVLCLDSDATVLEPMDELLLLPNVPVAMPRAYWLDTSQRVLGSHVLLVEPSTIETQRVLTAMHEATEREYDMEVLNKLYRDTAMVLPHGQYGLLTGEFRSQDHSRFLGAASQNGRSVDLEFDPEAVINAAKYVHFSDWPVPKPVYDIPDDTLAKHRPKCITDYLANTRDCRAQVIWTSLYEDYDRRRKEVCGDIWTLLAEEAAGETATG
ncbi:N-acetylglucosaminyltransferase [Ascosphaera acerosa]|nr:N-acetylglucosaminyltransferase [Ascosphaera acerosa]